jgi:hypothetical protein
MVKKGLVEPDFLGIKAFPNGLPSFRHWWEWTLLAIVAVSVGVGLFACLWYSYRSVRGLLRVRTINKNRLRIADGVYVLGEPRRTCFTTVGPGTNPSPLAERKRSPQEASTPSETCVVRCLPRHDQ